MSNRRIIVRLVSRTRPLLSCLNEETFTMNLALLMRIPNTFSLRILMTKISCTHHVKMILTRILNNVIRRLLLISTMSRASITRVTSVTIIRFAFRSVSLIDRRFRSLFDNLFRAERAFYW